MSYLLYAAAFLSGVISSMGLGGGMILILYLTVISGMPQINAQGLNLFFFIPVAVIALIMHTRNKLVQWKKIIPSIICGTASAVGGTYLAHAIGNEYLTKIFAVFIFITGIKELFKSSEKKSEISEL